MNFTVPPPLSLYIHIPWCVRKCPYCDFNSHTFSSPLPEQKYVYALLKDLERELPAIQSRSICSIFIGGGTPSLFSSETILNLFHELRTLLKLEPDIEITMEANPGTVEHQRLAEYRDCGVNRLSLGIQSFDDNALSKLGRIHSAGEAHAAIAEAMQAGFDQLNIDLMHGLPEQTPAQAVFDVETAVSYQPQHISHYQLTIEPDTAFYRRPPRLPDDDSLWEIQSGCHSILANNLYQQYEVSAWSKAGSQCRHNLNYWLFGDYLGIGAGAHQKITLPDTQHILRCCKQSNPNQYMDAVKTNSHVLAKEHLTQPDIIFEFMLNALRLTEGFPITQFIRHTGLPITSVEKKLNVACERQLLEVSKTQVKPTETGKKYLNDLLLLFMPD